MSEIETKKVEKEDSLLGGIILLVVGVWLCYLFFGWLFGGENYESNIGKTVCNATNHVCKGVIMGVKECSTNEYMDCYILDFGEGYNRYIERPISNSYVK